MARRGLGIVLTLIGTAVLIVAALFLTIYFALGRGPNVPSNAMPTLTVAGELSEVEPTDVFAYLRRGRARTLPAVVNNLRKAKTDSRIAAVLLKPAGFSNPHWGKIQEIRDAILDFRESGKPIYAYLEYGSDRDYYLASAADRVFLMPSSALDLTGVASYELFLRGTLDVFGVQPDLHRVGAYKNAVDTFTERGFTDAHREASMGLTRGLYDEIVRGVAQARGKDPAAVQALIDDGPFLPEQALQAGLLDGLAFEDQVADQLRASSKSEDRATIDSDDYTRVSLRSLGLNRGPRIAVIYAAGVIASGETRFDPVSGPVVGADSLNEYIRRARRDESIRAIVLRIDSPGGSATASDAIWRELRVTKETRADRPIVASMSDLAASGGYYIAAPADVIVAQPSTLTGSIGVFGGKFVTGGLYEKLGANIEATSAGRRAEMQSPERPYTLDEAAKLRDQLQAFYDRFVEIVADARRRTPADIDRVAQGRVWTGRQALEHGLVDALGGLDRAIELAKERAKIPPESDVEVVVYPPARSLFEMLSAELSGVRASRGFTFELPSSGNERARDIAVFRMLRGPLGIFRTGEPLALMPQVFLR
jgi:protease-4